MLRPVALVKGFQRISRCSVSCSRTYSDQKEKIKYEGDFVQGGSRPRNYFARKFQKFIEGYESLMKKHVPAAYGVYQSLSSGSKLLYRDISMYLRVSRDLNNGKPVESFSRKDLEVFYQIPRDLLHVVPTLVIVALPFTNYLILPLIYAFPKQLLSSHFWTKKQATYFSLEKHLNRVQYFDTLLCQFEKGKTGETTLKEKSVKIIEKLRSGSHPSVEEILEIKALFQDGHLFALHNITYGHLRSLSLSHGLPLGGVMPYGKLWKFGGYLWEIDRALNREGVESLDDDEVIRACFMRGVNPIGVKRSEALEYLSRWIQLSLELKERELSLLLHAPIFLGYNHLGNFGVRLR